MIMKTLSAAALATAVLAAPAFAQDQAPVKHVRSIHHYRGTYNQAPAFVAPRGASEGFNTENSFDRSRIGDHDADFNPAS